MKILLFAGSNRKGSLNRKLIGLANEAAKSNGAETTLLDLAQYPMPLYEGDLEAHSGIPETAAKLQELLSQHDALIIASPEYNGSFTPLLKNTIDWISRPLKSNPKTSGVTLFSGKPALILSASPGALGGFRGLRQLRELLTNINAIVIPQQLAISQAHQAFSESGTLNDETQQKNLEKNVKALVDFAQKLVK